MKRIADTLYLLSSFGLRVGMIEKSLIYTDIGVKLFPDHIPLFELHVLAHILQGNAEVAENLLSEVDSSTRNLHLLRTRSAILLDMPQAERQARARAYLAS